MKWNYYSPKFEYNIKFEDAFWSWAGHKLFFYDYIRNIKPKIIVELGTHMGTSFFSGCQAIKDGKLRTKFFAIDTWKGDIQSGKYGDEVWNHVNKLKNEYYGDIDAFLVRSYFSKAVDMFEDNSIDLLHIDGLHTYKAVKNDYETWRRKLSPKGIVMFHDIKVARKNFGVYKFWNEIKNNKLTFEFFHSYGLGVEVNSLKVYKVLKKEELKMQLNYSYDNEMNRSTQHLELENVNKSLIDELKKIKASKMYRLWRFINKCKKIMLNYE